MKIRDLVATLQRMANSQDTDLQEETYNTPPDLHASIMDAARYLTRPYGGLSLEVAQKQLRGVWRGIGHQYENKLDPQRRPVQIPIKVSFEVTGRKVMGRMIASFAYQEYKKRIIGTLTGEVTSGGLIYLTFKNDDSDIFNDLYTSLTLSEDGTVLNGGWKGVGAITTAFVSGTVYATKVSNEPEIIDETTEM